MLPLVLDYCQSIAAVVLMVAGVMKLLDTTKFTAVVQQYRLLPQTLVRPVAMALPVMEVVIGAAVLTGRAGGWAPIAAATMFGTFAGAIAVNLAKGRAHIACGCFGRDTLSPLRWGDVGRNLCLVVASVLPIPLLSGAESVAPIGPWMRLVVVLASGNLVLAYVLGSRALHIHRTSAEL